MGGVKNTTVVETHRSLSTRSVFVAKVIAVEGDPTWEVWKKELINPDEDNTLQTKRLTDKGSGRIIIYLTEKDNYKVANPLIPRFYNIFPRPGEFVKVIAYDIVDNDLSFDYIGPVIPSLINTNNSEDSIGKRNQDIFGNFNDMEPKIDFLSKNNDIKQIYPSPKDIALMGRGSSQILFKQLTDNSNDPKEYIIIRSGVYTKMSQDKIPIYNQQESFVKVTCEPDPKIGETDDGNYIAHIYKPKYDNTLKTTPPESNEIRTRVDIVGQNINLFTYPNIQDKAYSIPYGELLFEYLEQLQNWLVNHVHNIDGKPSRDPQITLGNNLTIDKIGNISTPGKGNKISLTKNIKVI